MAAPCRSRGPRARRRRIRSPAVSCRVAAGRVVICSVVICQVVAGCDRGVEPGDAVSTAGSTVAESAVWFTDVAVDVGLDVVHSSGARGEHQLTEIMGSGCAWIDADLDGDLDAYLVGAGGDPDAARNRLYRSDGSGSRFVDVSAHSGVDDPGHGMGCAVGDYDDDGDPDLYVTNFGVNRLFRNRGDGVFDDVTSAAGVGDPGWSASAVFLDIDDDADLDLFVTNYMVHPPHSTARCHDRAGRLEYCGPNSRFPPQRDTLYRNEGDGTFRDVTRDSGLGSTPPGNGLGVAAADVDEDGDVDIFVANDASANHLWINDGEGRFTDRAVEMGFAFNANGQAEAGMGIQCEDIDGDGRLDVLLTHLDGETHTLYRGLGAGRFRDATSVSGLAAASRPVTGFGMVLADLDHDGDVDLVATNGRVRRGPGPPVPGDSGSPLRAYMQTDQLFEHVEPGPDPGRVGTLALRFVERGEAAGAVFAEPHVGRGLASGDFDNDGDVDILITSCGGPVRLLRNDAPKKGRWLIVRALRSDAKGPAYGAGVTVRAGDRVWRRNVQPAHGYLSSHDARVHVGLGPAREVDVSVRWPDGASSERRGVAVDRVLTIVAAEADRSPRR